jgi:iron complex transport system ATP-binding protein
MITMSDGKVAADGTLTEVLTPQLLRDCFGVEASVVADPKTNSSMCIPHSAIRSGH